MSELFLMLFLGATVIGFTASMLAYTLHNRGLWGYGSLWGAVFAFFMLLGLVGLVDVLLLWALNNLFTAF